MNRATSLLRAHRAFAALLAIAFAFRVAVAVVHRPALFFSDSWDYLNHTFPLLFADTRPSGYPIILRALSAPFGLHPAGITALQHVAGLAGGTLLYAGLLRLGVRRWLAVAAAALVLLDFYAIALEQHLLAEAFFTFALVAGLACTIAARGRAPLLAAGGLLLAAAVLMRTAGIFLIPAWLVYVVWTRRGRLAPALACAALALPLLGYLAVHQHATGSFAFTRADGWFLYGRIGEISDCRGVDVAPEARPLCEHQLHGAGAVSYVWNPDSPAWRLFGTGPGGDPVHTDEQSRLLGTFARAVIRARPGRYAALVATDFGRYFVPGVGSRGTSDTAIHLPTHPWEIVVIPELRDRFLPGYTPEIRTGSKPLRAVADVLHTPRWLMGLLAIAALVAVLRGGPHRREIVLLTGAGLLMPLGAAATSDMVVRYLLPSVPLLVAGGVLALEDLRASRA